MASGEMSTSTSQLPPPYSPYSAGDTKGAGQAPNPPYPTNQGGYPTPQTNQPYPGGYPGPGAYPPAGYPPQSGYPPAGYPPSSGYPPAGGYSHSPTGPGYYPATQQPVAIHTTSTTTVVVRAGDGCVRCNVSSSAYDRCFFFL